MYLLHIFLFGFIGWLFVKNWKNTYWFWVGLGAFTIKMIALVFFVWIHQNYYAHYQPDFKLIFEDSSHLASVFYKNPNQYVQILIDKPLFIDTWHLATQPRAFFTVKIYSFLTIVTFNNFWLTAIYSSLLSLWGMWKLAHTLIQLFPYTKKAAIIAFLFLPSCVFWASATSKESILLFLISLIISKFLKIIHLEKNRRNSFFKSILVLLFFIVLWKIKYYYAFGLSISLILYVFLHYTKKHKISRKKRILLFCFVAFGGVLLSFLHPNIVLNALPEALYNNYILIIQASPKNSVVELGLEPNWWSILQNSPQALYLGLFSPMPWDSQNWQMILVSIENVLLMSLLIVVIWKMIQKKYTQTLDSNFLIMLFVYISIMAVFLALSSPNFGALSRYRCGFSPFLWYVVLSYMNTKKPSF
jgi:hypothetical protein